MNINTLKESSIRGLINPLIIDDEAWLKITIEGVYPVYWISNFGRVYSEIIHSAMRQDFVGRGYLKVSLKTNIGPKDYLVHRLMMIMFCPIEDPSSYIVNHLDAVKTHNTIDNLEWTDYSGNIIHAYNNGLRHIGEDHNWAVYSAEQVHEICRMMENRKSYGEISMAVFGVPLDSKISSTLVSIRNGSNWRSISSNYNIPIANRNCQIFTDEQIHTICKMIENDKSIVAKTIVANMDIDTTQMDTNSINNLYEVINRIKRKERFNRISCNYNF